MSKPGCKKLTLPRQLQSPRILARKSKAFTLIEAILVIGLLLVIAAISIPITTAQLQKNQVENLAKDTSFKLFLHQQNAYTGKNSKSYGISFGSSQYTLFIGNSLATAEETEVFSLPSGIQISNINLSGGATELVFGPGGLKPSASGTVNFSDGVSTYSLEINPEGLIQYTKP